MTEASDLTTYRILIDGAWGSASSGETFESFNPFTGRAWARIPRCDGRDADRAAEAAHKAFTAGPWADMTATARGSAAWATSSPAMPRSSRPSRCATMAS